MPHTVESYAAKLNLTMPETTVRVSRTPARFRQIAEPETVAQASNAATLAWRREFFEAVDLMSSELQRRFDQETMMLAASHKRALIVAAAGGTPVDLDTLQLPKELNTGALISS